MPTPTETLTFDMIATLRREASEAGDDDMADTCDDAVMSISTNPAAEPPALTIVRPDLAAHLDTTWALRHESGGWYRWRNNLSPTHRIARLFWSRGDALELVVSGDLGEGWTAVELTIL